MEGAFCPDCLKEIEPGAAACPYCGAPADTQNEPQQLPVGTLLEKRYRLGRVIGQGGFGITYLGRDERLEIPIAVKEYFPAGYANRFSPNSTEVLATRSDSEGIFALGRERFLGEARILARFSDSANIVCVRDYFEANGTAYIVMEYLRGKSLRQYLGEHGRLTFDEAFSLLGPVMLALENVHRKGLIHRDISPSNLMLLDSGTVKLLDFGTARGISPQGEKSLSVILTPAYAPEEQYHSRGAQGPWSDVYAMCATIYKLITGITPENAMNRLNDDPLRPPSACGAAISPAQEQVLLRGMAVRREDRIQSMEALYDAFRAPEPDGGASDGEKTVCGPGAVPSPAPAVPEPVYVPAEEKKEVSPAQDAPAIHAAAPPPAKTEQKRGRRAAEKKRSGGKRLLWPVLLGLAAVAAVLVLVFSSGSNPYREKGSHISSIRDETVTDAMLKVIDRDTECTTISFSGCTLSDEQIARIGKMERIDTLWFRNCSGFTSLAPLAGLSTLNCLELSFNYSDHAELHADTMFPVDFPLVTTFQLSSCSISDSGTFLRHFPNLKYLQLTSCSGSVDLEPCASMVSLESVNLLNLDSPEADFSALGACVSLKHVVLTNTGIDTVEWMRSLPKLANVELNDNALSSLEGLNAKPSLYSLAAENNRISDISALAGCTGLHSLRLTNNRIDDISALAGCTAFQDLELGNNMIGDVSPLSDCTALIWLDLTGSPVADIAPLSGCEKMQFLYLDHTKITTLDACEHMIDLKTFFARECALEDIGGLKNSTQLKDVRLSGNSISDISVLAKSAGKLETLLLSDNRIGDISALAGCVTLYSLAIDGNEISDIGVLADAKELKYLAAGRNRIADISALADHVQLNYIDLGDNEIADVSALATCTAGKQGLMLQNNRITDISALPVTVEYALLSLYGNPLSDISVIESFTQVNFIHDYLYLPWSANLDLSPVYRTKYQKVYIVETPIDQRSPIKVDDRAVHKENGNSLSVDPLFPSAEEADAEMADVRSKARESEGKVTATVLTFNYLNRF